MPVVAPGVPAAASEAAVEAPASALVVAGEASLGPDGAAAAPWPGWPAESAG